VTSTWDVIIVGAGPAGAMAAHRLGPVGARVLILEAAELPRPKPCGGGILSPASIAFPCSVDDLIQARADHCLRLYDHARPVTQKVGELVFVNRDEFDYRLVDSACTLHPNVQINTGSRVRQVEARDNRVRVEVNAGDQFECSYLIAADGVFSRTARCLGLNRKPLVATAIDAELEVTDEAWERERHRATFNHFCVGDGYGWIFPKGPGRLSCGVGSWRRRFRVPAALDTFLDRSFAPGEILARRDLAYPIPLYRDQRAIATDRVCLAGDAASLVEPVMGEGIRFALISGSLAGQAVADCLAGRASSCLPYQNAVQQRFANDFFDLARFILPIVLQAPDFFYRRFMEQGVNYFQLASVLAARVDSARSS